MKKKPPITTDTTATINPGKIFPSAVAVRRAFAFRRKQDDKHNERNDASERVEKTVHCVKHDAQTVGRKPDVHLYCRKRDIYDYADCNQQYGFFYARVHLFASFCVLLSLFFFP